MPKESAKQLRLFALKTEQKHKRRVRAARHAKAARRAQPEASHPANAEPEQLDLITAIDKLSPG
jgi:hypothetical protein